MKRSAWSHYKYFSGDIDSVSRKTKKNIIGKKMSKRKLKQRLSAVVITQNQYPEPPTMSDRFCPKCGCESTRTTGNMTFYPEVWVREYCLRCERLVGEADNSRLYHVLEFPEENYELY